MKMQRRGKQHQTVVKDLTVLQLFRNKAQESIADKNKIIRRLGYLGTPKINKDTFANWSNFGRIAGGKEGKIFQPYFGRKLFEIRLG